MTRIGQATALALLALLAGCGERESILPGARFDTRTPLEETRDPGAEAPPADRERNAALPFAPPAPVNHAAWRQPGGNARHRIIHPALSAAPSRIWSASIGEGETRRFRITAEPVMAEGRIFTKDARAGVMAHSASGAALWSRDLRPAGERRGGASGGGLALGPERLFATTGYGTLVALDPATGATIWRQDFDGPVAAAPAVKGGLVYVVSRDDRGWAIDAETGRIRWQVPGTPSPAGVVGGAAPAVGDRLAFLPFASSEVVAALRESGVRVWAAPVAGKRRGKVYARITEITGDPVIAGDTVYTGNQQGRVMALSASDGERRWAAPEGAYGMVWPSGGSVFLTSDAGRLLRLDAATGETIWATGLPNYRRERASRRRAVVAHYGPVLAGGRLWLASSDGALRGFDPVSGAAVAVRKLPGGAATRPIVVDGTLYVVSKRGELLAYR